MTAATRIQRLRQLSLKPKSRLFACMMVSLAVAGAYVAWFWYSQLYTSSVDLYHRAWRSAADNYFDRSALKNWRRFEHCYDSKITNDEDAVFYANKMLATLNDPYTSLHSAKELKLIAELQSERFVGLGVFLKTIKTAVGGKELLAVKSLMPGGAAIKAGIKPGDAILSINGVSSVGMSILELKQIARQRENKPTEVVVRRGKRKVRLLLVPQVVLRSNVELVKSNTGVAHILVRNFMNDNTADRVMCVLERTTHCKAIVLDLRDNPGGSVDQCLKLAGVFLKEGQLVTLHVRTIGGGHYRESCKLKPDCLERTKTDESGNVLEVTRQERLCPIAHGRPLIVLINGGTASAAEMLSAALQDNNRATLVGERSFGKGVAQAGLPIGNGAVLTVTCVHCFTPGGKFVGSGRCENKDAEGIEPDVRIAKGEGDAQLEQALRLVESGTGW